MNRDIKIAPIIGIILAILIVVPLVLGSFWRWQGGWGTMGLGMGGFMFIPMILLWGLIIWGIVALVRGVAWGNTGSATHTDSALEILKRRYARGEISREEFEDKKKELS